MDDDLAALVKDDTREKMGKAIDHVRHEMGNVRTGRASSALVEPLMVDYYGTPTPLRQLAGFSVPDAMLLVISPYDKGSLGAIEKAIMASDLGINPTNDGTVIRLAFPPLTEERRKELVKVVRHKAEEGEVAMRNLRRAGRHELEALQKDGDLGTDELERVEKDLEKITHEQVADRPAALAQRARAAAGLRGDDMSDDGSGRLRTSVDTGSGASAIRVPRASTRNRRATTPGRVRIIGAEPAGDTVREVTGPVAEEHAELPHWNDTPTGQVPAVLDRSNGEEPPVAPPTWREEETDWEAQEEVFEPAMLSDDLPAVGALLGERRRRRAPAVALRVRRHPGDPARAGVEHEPGAPRTRDVEAASRRGIGPDEPLEAASSTEPLEPDPNRPSGPDAPVATTPRVGRRRRLEAQPAAAAGAEGTRARARPVGRQRRARGT